MNLVKNGKRILADVDIRVGGNRPWDIQVNDDRFYKKVFGSGSLGLGESYVDEWWDSDDIIGTISRLSRISSVPSSVETFFFVLTYRLFNTQKKEKAIAEHYDLGNELYESFLDKHMQYSAGYFKNDTDTLETAQIQKSDFIHNALDIQKDDHVLDLGAGWGGFSQYTAEKYGCVITGVSIADAQIEYAKKRCKELPVTFIKQDYMDVEGLFDKVVICEMLEHVGKKNYSVLMKHVSSLLRPGGKVFIQVTTGENKMSRGFDPWLHKYIFPTGMIPRKEHITEAADRFFDVTDITDNHIDYERTLLLWAEQFDKNWKTIENSYDQKFYRMWKYYLSFCAGTFRERINTSTQIVLTKKV